MPTRRMLALRGTRRVFRLSVALIAGLLVAAGCGSGGWDPYRDELVQERLAPYEVGGVPYGIDYHLGATSFTATRNAVVPIMILFSLCANNSSTAWVKLGTGGR